jgi:hypothetical protein
MGDINIAELDTRTFHMPADPEVVAALPVVEMMEPGAFLFDHLRLLSTVVIWEGCLGCRVVVLCFCVGRRNVVRPPPSLLLLLLLAPSCSCLYRLYFNFGFLLLRC